MEKQIYEWKFKYKKVYKIVTALQTYYYRQPSIYELNEILKLKVLEKSDKIQTIALNCVLYPSPKEVFFNDVNIVVQAILTSTSFFEQDSFKKLINKCEAYSNTDIEIWKHGICKILPYVTLDYLDKLNTEEFITLVCVAQREGNVSFFKEDNDKKPVKKLNTSQDEVSYSTKEEKQAIIQQNSQELQQEYLMNRNKKRLKRL